MPEDEQNRCDVEEDEARDRDSESERFTPRSRPVNRHRHLFEEPKRVHFAGPGGGHAAFTIGFGASAPFRCFSLSRSSIVRHPSLARSGAPGSTRRKIWHATSAAPSALATAAGVGAPAHPPRRTKTSPIALMAIPTAIKRGAAARSAALILFSIANNRNRLRASPPRNTCRKLPLLHPPRSPSPKRRVRRPCRARGSRPARSARHQWGSGVRG